MTAVATSSAIDQGQLTHAASAAPTLDRHVVGWLRLEGLAAFITGIAIYGQLGGDWIWFIPAFLLVDVSAVGYLGGPRLGALTYDFAHNWAVALAVLGLGLALSAPLLALSGAVLVGHIGADRAVGYGLKLASGFKDTHLGRMGR
ncbi:MAG: DUF4260 domain-containing protein [Chloroflexota bacterium]|nr:DUF4260 domain-containing protein [Chloroflexota bacterium]